MFPTSGRWRLPIASRLKNDISQLASRRIQNNPEDQYAIFQGAARAGWRLLSSCTYGDEHRRSLRRRTRLPLEGW